METEIATRSYEGVTTKDIVKEMLTENTGSHFLDSGGAYGRNWSRNQGKDFDATPKVTCEWSAWRKQGDGGPGRADMMATVSLYHWLLDNFEFDAELQAELDQFAEENPDMNWLHLSEAFAEHLESQGRLECEPKVFNTYNDPDNVDLSQTIQYTRINMESPYEPSHLIINVHGGCDVRGGYASPKVMKLDCYEDYQLWENAKVHGICAGDWYWEYRSGYRTCDYAHEKAPADDILALPSYDIDWLCEEPLIVELDRAETLLASQRAALKTGATTLSADALTKALTQLDLEEEVLEADRQLTAARILAERHDVCTFVQNRQLYLVVADGTDEPDVYEVTAHNE